MLRSLQDGLQLTLTLKYKGFHALTSAPARSGKLIPAPAEDREPPSELVLAPGSSGSSRHLLKGPGESLAGPSCARQESDG